MKLLLSIVSFVALIWFNLFYTTPISESQEPEIQAFENVTERNLSNISIEAIEKVIRTLAFNLNTIWPDAISEAENKPSNILEEGKNPGLGVRQLHREGIDGRGVNVAIIDFPIYIYHDEFDGKIVLYKEFGKNDHESQSLHGSAVTSILVGNTIGTAPAASVYYAGVSDDYGTNAEYFAQALNWIINENRKLPKGKKIRVVSVSANPSGPDTPFTRNTNLWDKARANADREGILVIDATADHGIVGPCWYDYQYPEDPTKCKFGIPGLDIYKERRIDTMSKLLLVPVAPRTIAERYRNGPDGYLYDGQGGHSWAMPYLAGILALGWQVDSNMTKEEALTLLNNSATVKNGYRFVNPPAFIRQIRERKQNKNNKLRK